MKKVKGLVLLMACFAATTAGAQDKVEATIASDFVNQYIWRGQDLGDVSVQPTLGVAYKGFSLTGWGSVGLSDNSDTKEFDLTAAYQTGGFHIGITDYWFNQGVTQDGEEVSDARYFHYNAHSTTHVFEGNIGYDFGPVALNWYTNFAGNDGLNKSGKRAYSSYVEAAVPFKLADLDWTATVGAVPYATSFYGKANGFAVTNVSLRASKDIQVTKSWSVPLFAGITANPSTQKAYLVCGFTLRP
jgi:hypothetical protein